MSESAAKTVLHQDTIEWSELKEWVDTLVGVRNVLRLHCLGMGGIEFLLESSGHCHDVTELHDRLRQEAALVTTVYVGLYGVDDSLSKLIDRMQKPLT